MSKSFEKRDPAELPKLRALLSNVQNMSPVDLAENSMIKKYGPARLHPDDDFGHGFVRGWREGFATLTPILAAAAALIMAKIEYEDIAQYPEGLLHHSIEAGMLLRQLASVELDLLAALEEAGK